MPIKNMPLWHFQAAAGAMDQNIFFMQDDSPFEY